MRIVAAIRRHRRAVANTVWGRRAGWIFETDDELNTPMMTLVKYALGAATVALIVFVGFGAGLLPLIAVVTVYVVWALVLPVRVRAKVRFVTRPTVRSVPIDDTSIPETIRALLQEQRVTLEVLGFEWYGVIRRSRLGRESIGALYRNRTDASAAAMFMPLDWTETSSPRRYPSVEFETSYRNGETVALSNMKIVAPVAERFPGLVRQMPDIRDLRRLHSYFVKLVDRYELHRELGVADREPMSDREDVAEAYLELVAKSHEMLSRAGLLTESGVPGVLRPTWPMAVRMAAARVSPTREFLARRLHSASLRLQRELDGQHARRSTGLTRPATGWIMLIAGVVLTIPSLLTVPEACAMPAMGMSIAWSWARLRGAVPGWRNLALGGCTATILLGIPFALSDYGMMDGIRFAASPGGEGALAAIGLVVGARLALVSGAALTVEGFRLAATV